ncbi:MAG: nuclear transport factor 2 family protein [Alphaproteobacteria bacterium]|nr:nuclear transport factor 2 family protein [Alphaproteobacteria bacterium]
MAGALALGGSGLVRTAGAAETGDEAGVNAAGEALRQAMLAADRARLSELVCDQLSYGHSSGLVQDKAEFIDVIADKKTLYKSISLTDAKTMMAGDAAIVRHTFNGETESGGKANSSKLGVLQVWQKQDGHWRLLARQGYKT